MLAAGTASAQEVSAAAGALRSREPGAHSFGLSLSYSQDFARYLSGSVSYLNEGHVPMHHRDGIAAQLWLRTPRPARGFSFAVGYGPYRYFDTAPAAKSAGYVDAHGWGRVVSLAGTWRAGRSPWLLEMRYNRIRVNDGGMGTDMLLAGVGYRLDRDDPSEDPGFVRVPRNEAAYYRGTSIVNSFESERARAWSAEYRREFGKHWRGAVAVLDEGASEAVRRRGVAAQVWLEPSFYDDRLTLGIGAGPYIASDEHRGAGGVRVSALLSVTASVSITRHWAGRVTLSRVATRYHRDADVLLAGVAYRF